MARDSWSASDAVAQRNRRSETQTTTVYKNPITSSGYDPDGIQSLLNQDEIDWDGFDWDGWSWVTYPDLDGTDSWEDLDRSDKLDWYDANKDRFKDKDVTEFNWQEVVGPIYEADRASGAEGGTEINWDYYQNDPWYNLALDNLDMEIGDEGLTEEHLQEATKYLVETFRSVMNDGYQQPWDAELPESWQPKEMTTDYETPFEIPGIVRRMNSPVMRGDLQALRSRSGSNAEVHQKAVMAETLPQAGFKGEGRPEGLASLKPKGSAEMIANVQKILDDDAYPNATSRNPREWQDFIGIKSINSKNDKELIKKVFRSHEGILPKNKRGL